LLGQPTPSMPLVWPNEPALQKSVWTAGRILHSRMHGTLIDYNFYRITEPILIHASSWMPPMACSASTSQSNSSFFILRMFLNDPYSRPIPHVNELGVIWSYSSPSETTIKNIMHFTMKFVGHMIIFWRPLLGILELSVQFHIWIHRREHERHPTNCQQLDISTI
jgi:hypothetical protein